MLVQCPSCRTSVDVGPGADPLAACPRCSATFELTGARTVPYGNTAMPALASDPARPGELHAAGRRLEPGARIGPYRILEFLGEGGMGAVYKAEQTSLNRTIALKVLPAALAADPQFVERFRREGMALANLNHPHIVAIHDLASADGISFFVMEYVAGTSLRRYLTERRPAPLDALRVILPVCDALEYAHAQGVIHRDIKPENVLLDTEGRVKIADFGLARIVGGAVPPSLTLTNVVLGTLEYMAPEQRTSSRKVDHRADLYSVGVMIYEMATGDLPIGRFPLPSERAGGDARLDPIVQRALEPDPNRRYTSARELRQDVAALLGGERPTIAPAAIVPAAAIPASIAPIPAPPARGHAVKPSSGKDDPLQHAIKSAGGTFLGALGILLPMLMMLSIFQWERRELLLLGLGITAAAAVWACIAPMLVYVVRLRELDLEKARMLAESWPARPAPSEVKTGDLPRLSGGK